MTAVLEGHPQLHCVDNVANESLCLRCRESLIMSIHIWLKSKFAFCMNEKPCVYLNEFPSQKSLRKAKRIPAENLSFLELNLKYPNMIKYKTQLYKILCSILWNIYQNSTCFRTISCCYAVKINYIRNYRIPPPPHPTHTRTLYYYIVNVLYIHNKAKPYKSLLVLLYKKDKWTFYSINNHNSPTENHVFYNNLSCLMLCTARKKIKMVGYTLSPEQMP